MTHQMSILSKRQGQSGSAELTTHRVGNALVVHRAGAMTAESQTMAMAMTEDDEYDLVVVDLPVGIPISLWESVARLLPRGRQGVRLVIGGRSRETTALAGRWLSERLGRPVVAPDGTIRRAARGGLFVHSGHRSGWVRFQPGRPPVWEASRFPRPSWDSSELSETVRTSATAVSEPIPGGLWVRPSGHDARQDPQRRWLIETVPCQPGLLTIVLGAPHCPPVSLDDAARVWTRLPAEIRPMVRFAQYGGVSLTAGETLGQQLAELLREQVACFAGLPLGSADPPAVVTVGDDGSLGWQVFAREVGYRPGTSIPTLLSHRPPLYGVEEVAPAVYWSAPDAVVEIVQSGLWLRPRQDSEHGDLVRAECLDPATNLVVVDGTDDASTARMRWLAEDLVARLDPATRRRSQLVRLRDLIAARGSHPARVGSALGHVEPSALSSPAARTASPAGLAADAVTVVTNGPSAVLERVPAVTTTGDRTTASDRTTALTGPQPRTERIFPAPARYATPESFQDDQDPTGAPLDPSGFQLESPVPPPPDTVFEPAGMVRQPVVPASDGRPAPADDVFAEPPGVEPAPQVQPTPSAEASALPPSRGTDDERAWLRRNLGGEYGNLANSMARILSEHPGFQGASTSSKDAILTDAVAVRLYLSPQGESVDSALRTAMVGPHVPFARCVVAGLSRLPSHRGGATFAASPSAEELDTYRQRTVFTEWGFVNALSGPCAVSEGSFDVIVWAMTARRTALLEPETEHARDRVLFVPGTSFKLLGISPPDNGLRGQILLRELAAGEMDSGKVDRNITSLDELAITSLGRQIERWRDEEPMQRVPPSDVGRFGLLPGLA
jgi:hypothetical protein